MSSATDPHEIPPALQRALTKVWRRGYWAAPRLLQKLRRRHAHNPWRDEIARSTWLDEAICLEKRGLLHEALGMYRRIESRVGLGVASEFATLWMVGILIKLRRYREAARRAAKVALSGRFLEDRFRALAHYAEVLKATGGTPDAAVCGAGEEVAAEAGVPWTTGPVWSEIMTDAAATFDAGRHRHWAWFLTVIDETSPVTTLAALDAYLAIEPIAYWRDLACRQCGGHSSARTTDRIATPTNP